MPGVGKHVEGGCRFDGKSFWEMFKLSRGGRKDVAVGLSAPYPATGWCPQVMFVGL